ncbi:MAG: hypothetical protein AAFY26_21560 [Cyanobacteria bacterium J06638_22]
MSQQDNFVGGFILGAIAGGMVGGVLGVLAASRLPRKKLKAQAESLTRRSIKSAPDKSAPPSPQNIESARRGLEDKIAQLNEAIDDVRQKLGTVNGNGNGGVERSEVVGDRPD